jgi:hypothetical protein
MISTNRQVRFDSSHNTLGASWVARAIEEHGFNLPPRLTFAFSGRIRELRRALIVAYRPNLKAGQVAGKASTNRHWSSE